MIFSIWTTLSSARLCRSTFLQVHSLVDNSESEHCQNQQSLFICGVARKSLNWAQNSHRRKGKRVNRPAGVVATNLQGTGPDVGSRPGRSRFVEPSGRRHQTPEFTREILLHLVRM
jgi:hypothetical protein